MMNKFLEQYPLAKIDLAALKHNVSVIRQFAPKKKILAVIKADAYGHGLLTVAKALKNNVEAFGVARLEEAIQLRNAGIFSPILVMGGFESKAELDTIANEKLSVVFHSPEQLRFLESRRMFNEPIKVWLKLETGMHRLGIRQEELSFVWSTLKNNPNIHEDLVLMTHFAESENLDSAATKNQIDTFNALTEPYPGERSLANSAAIVSWQDSHQDWLRAGALLYGISPFPHKSAQSLGLKPVMTLSSRLKAIRAVKKGETVGYGRTWYSPESMDMGIVAIGYGDGYPRLVSPNTHVLLNGRIAPIIGRVSMDMLAISLKDHADACLGDEVILWGEGLPVENLAKEVGTDPREIVTGLTTRVHKI